MRNQTKDEGFLAYAVNNKLDISYNVNSPYFNSRATRIAFFKFYNEI